MEPQTYELVIDFLLCGQSCFSNIWLNKYSTHTSILILGTKSTVESGVYSSRLARLVSESRIRSLACPGLATRLESDPSSPEIRSSIAEYARQAYRLWDNAPRKLGLALCCTHFEYALPFWQEEFRRVFGEGVFIVNPNELLAPGLRADSFSYHARIPFFSGAQESIGSFFRNRAPAISFALETARPESGLFSLEI